MNTTSINVQLCPFCQRTFHFVDLYQQHVPTCEFFYKTQRDRQRDSESIEALPPAGELFRLVKHLQYEQTQLINKVARMELILRRVKKRAILSHTPSPTISLNEWIQGFRVQVAHIHCVFQDNLLEGMRRCMDERIDQEGLIHVPMRVSPERPSVIYVWSMEEQKWEMCSSSQLDRIIDHLAAEFIRVYCEWEDENLIFLQSSQENKDKQVVYMLKITDSGTKRDRFREQLREWLRVKLRYV